MVKITISFVVLLTLMIGCGFKGPLYLPPQTSSNHPSAVTHKVESSNGTNLVHESQSTESHSTNYGTLKMNSSNVKSRESASVNIKDFAVHESLPV